jgi:hypothetical protein
MGVDSVSGSSSNPGSNSTSSNSNTSAASANNSVTNGAPASANKPAAEVKAQTNFDASSFQPVSLRSQAMPELNPVLDPTPIAQKTTLKLNTENLPLQATPMGPLASFQPTKLTPEGRLAPVGLSPTSFQPIKTAPIPQQKPAHLVASTALAPSVAETAWGGAQAAAQQAKDIGLSMGFTVSSEKRSKTTSIGSKSTSDHHVSQTNAFALDFPAEGQRGTELAQAIARAYGVPEEAIGTFEKYNFQYNDTTYRMQILWGVKDHFDHVHVGVRRVD